jgi:NitT/TauT family transport system ATP-binding protein
MLELTGLDGFADAYPAELSGGMAQRVAIGRALIHDPEVLLLDEPFGSLDALTREQMSEELLRIWARHRKTVLMVTHSISESVLLADRVLVMSRRPGQLVADVAIPLPRPRTLDLVHRPDFMALTERLRHHSPGLTGVHRQKQGQFMNRPLETCPTMIHSVRKSW